MLAASYLRRIGGWAVACCIATLRWRKITTVLRREFGRELPEKRRTVTRAEQARCLSERG